MGKVKSWTDSFPVEFVCCFFILWQGGHCIWLTTGLWAMSFVSRWTGEWVCRREHCSLQWLWFDVPHSRLTDHLSHTGQEVTWWAGSPGAAIPVKMEPAQNQANIFNPDQHVSLLHYPSSFLPLPRKGFYGAFPPAECSHFFPGISMMVEWFRWAHRYRKELACPLSQVVMASATRNQAQHQDWVTDKSWRMPPFQ